MSLSPPALVERTEKVTRPARSTEWAVLTCEPSPTTDTKWWRWWRAAASAVPGMATLAAAVGTTSNRASLRNGLMCPPSWTGFLGNVGAVEDDGTHLGDVSHFPAPRSTPEDVRRILAARCAL